ncbi:MAG: OadG family protein [Ruminococcus flavefaciens]|nr:OadG family protein [Ruminococcus flavefaciens]MCM1229696.1 OadG family protein [Ruminococcus flavefaciens]
MNFFTLAVQTADSGTKMELGDAAITAVFGYAVVFIGLVLLMALLYLTGAIFSSREAKAKAESAKKTAEAVEAPKPVVQEAPAKTAPGSAGHIKLHNVPDKEAAMIMAIVADTLQTPLNELHFISIKEVK